MTDILLLTEAATKAASAMNAHETETLEARRKRVLAYGRALLELRKQFKADRAFHHHLQANGLAAGTSGFRSDAMWLAKQDEGLLTQVNQSPHSNPTQIRHWLRKQAGPKLAPANVVVNEKDRRRNRMNGDYSARRVAHDFLELGHPLTDLEAIILFGELTLQADVHSMRQKGVQIETSWVSYPEVLKRLNKMVTVTVPTQLPIKDLQMAQYRIIKR